MWNKFARVGKSWTCSTFISNPGLLHLVWTSLLERGTRTNSILHPTLEIQEDLAPVTHQPVPPSSPNRLIRCRVLMSWISNQRRDLGNQRNHHNWSLVRSLAGVGLEIFMSENDVTPVERIPQPGGILKGLLWAKDSFHGWLRHSRSSIFSD